MPRIIETMLRYCHYHPKRPSMLDVDSQDVARRLITMPWGANMSFTPGFHRLAAQDEQPTETPE